jgi:hypothetical protein
MARSPLEVTDGDNMEQALQDSCFDWHDFQPEMLQDNDTFAVELTTYRDHLDSLLAHKGNYVVIKGTSLVGVYDDLDAAVKAGFEFAPELVLIKKIVEKEVVRELGHVLP